MLFKEHRVCVVCGWGTHRQFGTCQGTICGWEKEEPLAARDAAFVSGRQLAASQLLCANSRSRLDLFWGTPSNFAEKPRFLIFKK